LAEAYQNIGCRAQKIMAFERPSGRYVRIRIFFELPDEVNRMYEKPEIGFFNGYTGKGKEHARVEHGDWRSFSLARGQELAQLFPDTSPSKQNYPENYGQRTSGI